MCRSEQWEVGGDGEVTHAASGHCLDEDQATQEVTYLSHMHQPSTAKEDRNNWLTTPKRIF